MVCRLLSDMLTPTTGNGPLIKSGHFLHKLEFIVILWWREGVEWVKLKWVKLKLCWYLLGI